MRRMSRGGYRSRYSGYRRRSYRRPYRRYGGYRRRYARGRGPYYISGGLNLGDYGNIKGGYYSSDIDLATAKGLGPYVVRKNSLTGDIESGGGPPIIRNSKSGEAVIISHREYLKDITAGGLGENNTSAFKLEKWDINPGNPKLFPWLSFLAQNFQEYELRGMIVEVKTMSSDFSTNQQMGTLFGATDYNLYNKDPSTKQQIEMLEYSNSCKPSRSLVLPIECEPANNGDTHKFIAVNSKYNGGDKNLYDWGNLFIGSQGLPETNGVIGELWISYEVAFFKPILKQNVLDPMSHCVGGSYILDATDQYPFGASPSDLKLDTLTAAGLKPTITGNDLYLTWDARPNDYVVNFTQYAFADNAQPNPISAPIISTAPLVVNYPVFKKNGGNATYLADVKSDVDNLKSLYYLIPKDTTFTIKFDGGSAVYGTANVAYTLIVNGFNVDLCGYMVPEY